MQHILKFREACLQKSQMPHRYIDDWYFPNQLIETDVPSNVQEIV